MSTATFQLDFAVRTPDGREIVPPQTGSLDEAVAMARSQRPAGGYRTYPLLEHGTIATDLQAFLNEEPYRRIFAEAHTLGSVLAFTREACYPPLVLDCLDWFRESDFPTYRHILLVCALTTRLAWALTGDRRRIAQETVAGPTHDLGKVCVPLEVLRKGSALTPAERRLLEQHTWAGYLLLVHCLGDEDHPAVRVARDHHERRDGSGYPRGVRLDDTLVEIVAAADVYDALISPRPYRSASYDNRTALEEMTAMVDRGQLAEEIVCAAVACNRSDRPHLKDCHLSRERRGTPPAGNNYGRLDEVEDENENADAIDTGRSEDLETVAGDFTQGG
jgi:HD-GYP domain-containing protein (c-di-GMP phosphodiesterase class II)